MKPIEKELSSLEEKVRLLEPEVSVREEITNQVFDYACRFVDGLESSLSYSQLTQGDALSDLAIGEPVEMDKILEVLSTEVDKLGINSASGGHLGYIPGGGVYSSALGDYLAAVANKYAGIFFSAPGAVRLERMILNWMAKLIGYPENCGGDLTSGSSIAALIAINTARERADLRSENYSRAVVYLSDQTHHSLEKALRISGMGDCIRQKVPLDGDLRMRTAELEKCIKADLNDGRIPWMVFSTAGTTDCGVIDPLTEIGRIAKKFGVWHHIDAAYGGFFVMVDKLKEKLIGLSVSDSIALDPHKGLSLPFGIGAVLIKEKEVMIKAHNYQADYMRDARLATDEISPSDVSPELTKHFRGLRMWLPLMLHGVGPFKHNLEEKRLLALYFYSKIKVLPDFEVWKEPDLSIVVFRYVPARGNPNLFNEMLVKAIHEDGRIFLTSTIIKGKVMLRLAIVSFRTHKSTIDLTLSVLNEKINMIGQKFSTSFISA